MKWYNKENMQRYKFDVSYPTQSNDREDELIQHFATWTPKIAITFSREYAAIGTLDLNDLVGIANLHMINAVRNFDWEYEIHVTGIKDAWIKVKDIKPEEQAAVMWKYVKKSVMLKLRNEITMFKDPMRTHRVNGDKRSNAPLDNFLTQLFPDYFNEEYHGIIDTSGDSMWDIEQLAVGLEVLMDEILSFKEKDIIKMSFGIDCDKWTIKQIAEHYHMSEIGIKVSKKKSITKLIDHKENKQIIENYYTI